MDTEGKPDAPFFGNLFIEEIVQYHKGKTSTVSAPRRWLSVAYLAPHVPDHIWFIDGGIPRALGTMTVDIQYPQNSVYHGQRIQQTVSWESTVNTGTYLNFSWCLYYFEDGGSTVYTPPTTDDPNDGGTYTDVGGFLSPAYNFGWSHIVDPVTQVPLGGGPLFDVPGPGGSFTASATGPAGTTVGYWDLNPDYHGQPLLPGGVGTPIALFTPLSGGSGGKVYT